MDGQGSIPPLDLEAMRSLSKQRLPIQSKHVAALLEYVEQIQREARDKALEEAAQVAEDVSWRLMSEGCDPPISNALKAQRAATETHECALKIRALKDKGE